jgi:hypothetical protein
MRKERGDGASGEGIGWRRVPIDAGGAAGDGEVAAVEEGGRDGAGNGPRSGSGGGGGDRHSCSCVGEICKFDTQFDGIYICIQFLISSKIDTTNVNFINPRDLTLLFSSTLVQK